MPDAQLEITLLLSRAADGEDSARSELYRLVAHELHRIADAKMRHENPGHTLQATVLVNDAFVKLIGRDSPLDFRDRKHFYRTAALVMRRMLIDHARRPKPPKSVGIDPDRIGARGPRYDVLALHEALDKLAQLDPRQAEVVELHHFAGRTLDDTAKLLGVSRTTVKNEWRAARAWLYRELCDDGR